MLELKLTTSARIGKGTYNAGYNASPDMVPAERRFVNLCESETTTFIWVIDVCEIDIGIVESAVAAFGSSHRIHWEHGFAADNPGCFLEEICESAVKAANLNF